MQIKDNDQIQPPLLRPDIADIARPFPAPTVGTEVSVQKVRRDIEAIIAIRGRLELLVPLYLNAVLAHQPADAAMLYFQAEFL